MQPAKKPKIQLLPDIDWVEIPAGEFIYGEDKAQQTLSLETFYMARYPVTNIQYQTFIDAGGYADDRWWLDLEKPEPKKSTWPQSNRPRIDVSWYEAVAFCRWLSAQLGYKVRPPTEQEWEKAARGPDGGKLSWGNDYQAGFANVDDKSQGGDNLKQTAAVGMYPQGASPYGVEDMMGNVLEWCLNENNKPEDIDIDSGGVGSQLRGGSWAVGPDRLSAASRGWASPGGRYNYIGFRLMSSLPLL